MPPRPAAGPRSNAASKKNSASKPGKGTVAAEDVRLQAKADRTRKYMAAARVREQELERSGMFF